jgi:AcrR family transcriptional regulator
MYTSARFRNGSERVRFPAMASTRDRILKAAIADVRRSGVESVSIRAIAEQLGVTPMAVYKHFEDKAALLSAVVWAGFERWERYIATAHERATPRELAWEAMIQYREFALAEPRLFDLMFVMRRDDVPHVDYSVSFTERPVFAGVVRAIAALAADGALPGHPRDAMLALWATVHGLCALHASGRFGPNRDAFRADFERILAMTFPGLAPRR